MVPPGGIGFNDETKDSNVFQTHKEDLSASIFEFDKLVDSLNRAGVGVTLLRPSQFGPDSHFPNNWISTHAPGILGLSNGSSKTMWWTSNSITPISNLITGTWRGLEVSFLIPHDRWCSPVGLPETTSRLSGRLRVNFAAKRSFSMPKMKPDDPITTLTSSCHSGHDYASPVSSRLMLQRLTL